MPPRNAITHGTSNIKFAYFSNEFPKDDLQDIFRHLHNHSKGNDHAILAQFLSEATLAVKQEIRQLPTELKQLIPPFTTVLSWVENTELREGLLCGAVDGVLLIVVQIATYIGYVENHPETLEDFDITSLAGLGIGLLSATAVSLSSSLANFPSAGADAVRLAFRMGVHVQSVSEKLEPRDLSEIPDTWAYVVHNCDPPAVRSNLDAMQTPKDIPQTGKIFVSAVSRDSVTISGPPARLRALLNKADFCRGSKLIPLPVFGGLCHAPHVYSSQDMKSIVHSEFLSTINRGACPQMRLYSTSTGQPYLAENAAELFECVVSELLTQAICWGNVIEGFVDRVKVSAASEVSLHSFGNSIPLRDLTAALNGNIPDCKTSINDFVGWISETNKIGATPRGPAQSKLAIVGMSCRLPGGATDTESFWEVLEQGLDVSRQIPADRFDVGTHFDPTGKQLNKSMTEFGCFIDYPGLFDAPFFNMSPKEAQTADPQMRLALVTAYEALERSGYVGGRTAATLLERIGTWYGQAADDYREVNQGQEVSTYYIPGGCRAFGPGRINYFFKFAGPSYSVDTACSSGLAAIEVACQALWNAEVDTAVAGGLNVLTNPDGFAGLCNGYFLTKGHNACKTWDATADGYCRADGIGTVVIKRLEDAEADNDNILGVILGTGTNHSAQAVSITHPHAGHQAYLSRQVLRQAGVNPLDVSYVELHGTGTQAGDYEEMQGIMDVYAPLGARGKSQPLHIGAVKSNVGHSESAAGTTALLKVLLMFQKNTIPPHVGIKTEMNPRIPQDFDKRNLHVPFEPTPWTSTPGKKRLATVNNFGAAGGNTTMILEEPPSRNIVNCDRRPVCIIAVSAKTKISLMGNIERLIGYLDAHPDVNLGDLAYTTTARRYQHGYRIAVSTSNAENLKEQLRSWLDKVDSIRSISNSEPPQIAFTFTGQGASYKSMNLELYRDLPTFRGTIHDLNSFAEGQGFPSFIPALDGSYPKDHQHSPVVTQLALVCTEIALAKYWASLGVKADIVVGHSLGEYAAMHVAGVITASEAIFMVGRRAQMLQDKCESGSHTMMAVRASLDQIAENAGGNPFTIACINSPGETVLSGTKDEMESVSKSLEAAGFRCIKLDVAFAFHSDQTDPILNDFEAIAKTGVIFQEPKVPVVSPLLGKVIFDGKTINANYVRRATRGAVNFLTALENAQEVGGINDDTIWIEIGPHPVCNNFVRSCMPSAALTFPSIRRGEDNWKTVAESLSALHLAGVSVGWNEFHRPFESKLRLLDLPTYAWNNKNYWLQYKGDWCLTKGNDYYTTIKQTAGDSMLPKPASEIQTSTVQQIIRSSFDGSAGSVTIQSDLMQPDFLAAAHGHGMNGCGVVTSSIHGDIAYTLGSYLLRKLNPNSKTPDMDIANLVVTKGLVAQSNTKVPQLIRITAETMDIRSSPVNLTWHNVDNDGNPSEPIATATLSYANSTDWISSWSPMNHLIQSRIEDLKRMADAGEANRFSRNMAYTLFASNLVDYADKYRGMRSVVMHDLEAFAEVELTTKESGVWTVPPYFIDSVAHLAGFIMNCSDTIDTRNNFCVTPGWNSMRFATPLTPGAKFCSYVKMIPTVEDPQIYLGDVYVLQDDAIVGMVGGIKFRRYPRLLLSRFFSPPDKVGAAEAKPQSTAPQAPAPKPAVPTGVVAVPTPPPSHHGSHDHLDQLHTSKPTAKPNREVEAAAAPSAEPATPVVSGSTARALELIANEAGIELSDLQDETSFADLGVDSLMSLVIAEKFRKDLNVKVSGSLFLDYPKIGDLTQWLQEYHS